MNCYYPMAKGIPVEEGVVNGYVRPDWRMGTGRWLSCGSEAVENSDQ